MSIGLSGLLFEWPFKTGLTVYRNKNNLSKLGQENIFDSYFSITLFLFTLRLLVSKQNFAKRLILNADRPD